MKKKRDKTVFLSPDTHTRRHFGSWLLPGAFIPVPTHTSHKRPHQPFIPQLPSPWQRFIAWLCYSAIQIRWDIERWLARKLHRRWF